MTVMKWQAPIEAPLRRSLELKSVHYEQTGITVTVSEEEGKEWRVLFTNTQGVRITSFESADLMRHALEGQTEGALFEFEQSDWMKELGRGKREYMNRSRHFVLCCYDEIVEVVAWDVSFEVASAHGLDFAEKDPA